VLAAPTAGWQSLPGSGRVGEAPDCDASWRRQRLGDAAWGRGRTESMYAIGVSRPDGWTAVATGGVPVGDASWRRLGHGDAAVGRG